MENAQEILPRRKIWKGALMEKTTNNKGKKHVHSKKINIFAEVGSHKMQFTRLFKELDKLVGEGKLKANIFAQTGFTNYYTKNFEIKGFISENDLIEKIKWANVVVAHGGAGNIISALSLSKPLVLVPRRAELNEHTDDHQTQLAKALAQEKTCVAVYNIKELFSAIQKASKMKQNTEKERDVLVKEVRKFIEKQVVS